MEHTSEHRLKHLVQCRFCSRQYDTEGMAVGSRFHCSCGEVLTTESVAPRDSAVVRCSACGGARDGDEPNCGFCQADFTVHERDLAAICPGCATRLPRTAKFCHGCGVTIDLLASKPGGPSDRTCPSCGDGAHLRSRRLGEIGAAVAAGQMADRQLGAVLECPRCAGLWVAAQAFQQLERQAKQLATIDEKVAPTAPVPPPPDAIQKPAGKLYRPCVTCGELMQRRNYARRSGVVLDVCRDHGIWFDEKELESILEWIRRGGWEREETRRGQERRAEKRRASRPPVVLSQGEVFASGWLGGFWMFAVLAEVLEGLFDLGDW